MLRSAVFFASCGLVAACSSSYTTIYETAGYEGGTAPDAAPPVVDAPSRARADRVPVADAGADAATVDAAPPIDAATADAASPIDAATPVDAARDCAAAPVCLHALPGDDPTGLPCGDLTNACGTTLGCNVTNGGATACMGAPPGTACINNVCARCGVPTDACGLAGCCPHGCTYPGVGAPTCLP